ncbi:hypothetical protein FRX31_014267 [Thalictrum thalictroides]|uniref:FBD domain-containing protein n=1 Tax=Thalictrum thalictroides TaxID=46969 RepID=A0A7J6WFB4_THATH|nr:hypothetical protein FRX31_014267 [Thalictrum thalictroides]
MANFKRVPHELGFVEFILLNALALETMSIEWKEGVQIDKELLHVLVKMMQFKRASSEAIVLFSGLP